MDMQSFILPANGAATPDSIARKRKMAEAMLQSGMDTSPVASPWQGAARMAQALVGGLSQRKADKQEAEGKKSAKDALVRALTGGDKASMIDAMGNPWMDNASLNLIGDAYERANQPPPAPELKDLGNGQFYQFDANNPQGGQVFTPQGYNPQAKQPDIVELYDEQTGMPYKAQFNPQTGGFDRIGGIKAPSGTQLQVDPATGQVTFQQGAGLKPLTEAQSKDTVYTVRASGALPTIEKFGDALTSFPESVGGSMPYVGNYMKSDNFQLAEQAGNEFLTSLLRKDSGATITPEEHSLYGTTNLPRPGDSKVVLEQKKAARGRAIEAMRAGLPPSAIIAAEKALQGNENPASAGQTQEEEYDADGNRIR